MIIAASFAALATSAHAVARGISTDARRPPMAIPGVADSNVMAMFLYSNTTNADMITLGDVSGNAIPPALFCTGAIAGTCAASTPGAIALFGMTDGHGALPNGIPVPFDTYFDNNQPIYSSGPVQLVLTNTTACNGGVNPCSFATDLAVNSPTNFESGQLLMDWVLPCPGHFYDPGTSISVTSNPENAGICGTAKPITSASAWTTYGFPGAPSLDTLIGASNVALLDSQLASGNLYFVAFQDTVGDPTATPDPYTYDSAVMAIWFQRVPEPVSLALFGGGLAGLAGLRRRKTS